MKRIVVDRAYVENGVAAVMRYPLGEGHTADVFHPDGTWMHYSACDWHPVPWNVIWGPDPIVIAQAIHDIRAKKDVPSVFIPFLGWYYAKYSSMPIEYEGVGNKYNQALCLCFALFHSSQAPRDFRPLPTVKTMVLNYFKHYSHVVGLQEMVFTTQTILPFAPSKYVDVDSIPGSHLGNR